MAIGSPSPTHRQRVAHWVASLVYGMTGPPLHRPRAMGSAPRILLVDHTALSIARQLHAVQMVAYAQEAALLGAIYFPPLERTVENVRAADESLLAAFVGEELVGAVSVSPDPEGMGMTIASLVVSPQFQRQGIGTALVARVLTTHGVGEITVQTGARNVPALSLYMRSGFIEFRRWLVGREPLELVKLLRTPDVSSDRSRNVV